MSEGRCLCGSVTWELTAEDLARLDRKRKGKKLSNQDWVSRSGPEAKIAKMKDGTTHLAYKPEHAVDLDTGAVVAAELHPADEGDTTTLPKTLAAAEANLEAVDVAPTAEPFAAYNCHCKMCHQKTRHGTAFGTYYFVRADQFRWTSDTDSIVRYKSSYFATRNSCDTCGSVVPNPSEDNDVIPCGAPPAAMTRARKPTATSSWSTVRHGTR